MSRTDDAVDATRELVESGLHVTLDFLGEDTLDATQADATVAAYLDVLAVARPSAGLARNAEVSVKLSAVGQALPGQRREGRRSRTPARSARPPATPAPR